MNYKSVLIPASAQFIQLGKEGTVSMKCPAKSTVKLLYGYRCTCSFTRGQEPNPVLELDTQADKMVPSCLFRIT